MKKSYSMRTAGRTLVAALTMGALAASVTPEVEAKGFFFNSIFGKIISLKKELFASEKQNDRLKRQNRRLERKVDAAEEQNRTRIAGVQDDDTLSRDAREIRRRGDVAGVPRDLKRRLSEMAGRPHSLLPLTIFAEAEDPSLLFQYYLLDSVDFEPNVFNAKIPGINDKALQTGANFANDGLPTIGSVRLVVEPKPGLPTDPNDPRAFIDVFTDISGLFVINNEAGWYEGWMIQDIPVPEIAYPNDDGSAKFNTITHEDAEVLEAMGSGNNVPGNVFTVDGEPAVFPSKDDVFGVIGKNTVAHPVSMGAWNTLQQSDGHAYWEFNAGTNWIFPHYELFSTGGAGASFANGGQYAIQRDLRSIIPGSGPMGTNNGATIEGRIAYGDDPNNPRDPDRTEAEEGSGQAEERLRFVPSAVDREILYNVFLRQKSFMPTVTEIPLRFFYSYAAEVAKVDLDDNGVISFDEADINGMSADGQPNTRLYLSPTEFNRFAVTRELNDGLLAPRFAPSERGYVMSGNLTLLDEPVEASVLVDGDLR